MSNIDNNNINNSGNRKYELNYFRKKLLLFVYVFYLSLSHENNNRIRANIYSTMRAQESESVCWIVLSDCSKNVNWWNEIKWSDTHKW